MDAADRTIDAGHPSFYVQHRSMDAADRTIDVGHPSFYVRHRSLNMADRMMEMETGIQTSSENNFPVLKRLKLFY